MAIAVVVTTAATLPVGPAFAAAPDAPARQATSASSPVDVARAAAFAHASATGVGPGDSLRATDVMTDPDGKRHVRFVRSHQGLPVLGGDLVIHLGGQSAYLGVTRAADHSVKPSTTEAKLTAGQAERKAAAAAEGDAGTAQLVVDARDGAAALAYQVRVTDSGTTSAAWFPHGRRGRADRPDPQQQPRQRRVHLAVPAGQAARAGETANPVTGTAAR